jgi:hypothetical protein
MRYFPHVISALAFAGACGSSAQLGKNSAQYKQVEAMAASELKCTDDKLEVRSIGESKVVVEGCKRSTMYVYNCRQPGPRELAYVSSTPAPPSEESIEAVAEDEAGDAPQIIELRQQQIKYSQELVANRLADVQDGAAKGYAPRHKVKDMPKFWYESECRYMHEE